MRGKVHKSHFLFFNCFFFEDAICYTALTYALGKKTAGLVIRQGNKLFSK